MRAEADCRPDIDAWALEPRSFHSGYARDRIAWLVNVAVEEGDGAEVALSRILKTINRLRVLTRVEPRLVEGSVKGKNNTP